MLSPDESAVVDITAISQELQCPICLDVFKDATVVKECLHRFCSECISKCLRTAKLECPTCRIHIPSRRSLRRDERFNALASLLEPAQVKPNMRAELGIWRDFHRSRTAEFKKQKSRYISALESQDAQINSTDSSVEGKRVRLLDNAMLGTEVGLSLRFFSGAFPSVHTTEVVSKTESDDISQSIYRIDRESYLGSEDSFFLAMEKPYMRVPSRATFRDLRLYLSKVLASTGKVHRLDQIHFAVLNSGNMIAPLRDEDIDTTTMYHVCSTLWDRKSNFCILYNINRVEARSSIV